MKIALCLSGQPRNALKTYSYIYKNIIEPNNADVFMHLNFDNSNRYMEKSHKDNGNCIAEENIDKKLINLYKPKSFLVEKQKIFKNDVLNIPEERYKRSYNMNKKENWTREQHKIYTLKNMMSMFYGIFKVIELKETYALENNIHYDYVIRLRYDAIINQPIVCKNYNTNFIYYANMNHKDNLISDWFNFGSNKIMNIYGSIFLNIEYLNCFDFFKQEQRLKNTLEPSNICGGLFEHTIRDIYTLFRIPSKSLNIPIRLL